MVWLFFANDLFICQVVCHFSNYSPSHLGRKPTKKSHSLFHCPFKHQFTSYLLYFCHFFLHMIIQKADVFLNIFLQNILELQMKSRIAISRYNLVMHSFFARNNYSALSPPAPGAQNDRKFGKCYAKNKAVALLCKVLFGQEPSPSPCTTCPSLGPKHRQAQD